MLFTTSTASDLPPNWVETGLRDGHSRFVLGWGVIAEGRMAALPIIEHLNVFDDVLNRFAPCHVLPLVDELVLQYPKEALHDSW